MEHNEIVELMNGIISHGSHDFKQFSEKEFALAQIAYADLESLPSDGLVYIKAGKTSLIGNLDIDKEALVESGEYQVWHDFGRFFDCEIGELIELYNEIDSNNEDDFYIEFDGNEYRIISENSIWDIYVEDVKNTVEDGYDLKLDSIPDFIAFNIDWQQTAKNAFVDGYGHTFSGYDGEESMAAGYWIFRTN